MKWCCHILFTGPSKNSEPKHFCCFFPGRDQYYEVVFVGFVVAGAPEGSTEYEVVFWPGIEPATRRVTYPLHHGGFSAFFLGETRTIGGCFRGLVFPRAPEG